MSDEMEKEWLEKLSDKGELIQLIQDMLGCGCPMEVFEHIQMELIRINNISMLQLMLGNRLLVWIVDRLKMNSPKDSTSQLLEQGRIERDTRHLNRFRLVLVGEVAEPEAEELKELPGTKPDKVHLHILPQL
jgi:hypothetical protein